MFNLMFLRCCAGDQWQRSLQTFVPGQIVGDLVPGRFGADKDVPARPDGRIVAERAHGDVHESSVANERKQEGTACPAAGVIHPVIAEDHEPVGAFDEAKLVTLNPGKGLEGRACRPPALGAVTIPGVEEFIGDFIMDSTAQASTGQHSAGRFQSIGHGLFVHLKKIPISRK
jgi:hypothetical protein